MKSLLGSGYETLRCAQGNTIDGVLTRHVWKSRCSINYAIEIRDELNSYSTGIATYKVDIINHDGIIECIIDITEDGKVYPSTTTRAA
jgi:hypothetical protein